MAARLAVNVVSPVQDVITVAPPTLELSGLGLGYRLFTIEGSLCASEEWMHECRSEPPQSRRDSRDEHCVYRASNLQFHVTIRDAINLSRTCKDLSLFLVIRHVEGSPHRYATGRS